MNNIKSCAGCKALVKQSGRGSPLPFSCWLKKEQDYIDNSVLDKRLDSYVDVKPVCKCKCRTNKEMFKLLTST